MSQEYEAERAVSRDEAATALRQLADGVAAGSVSIYADAGPVAVDIPDDLTFAAELEQFEGNVELEAELEWQTDDGAIREPADEAASDSESDEPVSDAAEPADARAESASEASESDAEAIESTQPVESAADLVGPATDADAPGDESESKATFELFRDAADEWRWRLRHRNGNVIADSGEGYDRKAGAINGLESVKSNAPLAVVEEQSEE